MDETLTLEVESIAAGGDGVARHGSLVVFIPRTAPGDRVRVRVKAKGRFARGSLLAVEQPGPARIAPQCPHYERDQCGGCQLQHLSLDAQRAAKARMVRDAFARIAKRTVSLPDVHGAGAPWRYRRKLTVALRRVGNSWRYGLHRHGQPDEVFQLRDCVIADERLVAGIHEVMKQGGHLLPRVASLRLSLRRDAEDVFAVIEGGTHWPEAQQFAEALPGIAGIWWVSDHGQRRCVMERRAIGATGASFVQVNADVAAHLATYVQERVRAHAPRTVIDAYAGAGDTAVALASRGMQVTAVELDAEASAFCSARLEAPSRAITAPVEQVFTSLLPADVVVLNPPRTGVDEAVTQALASASVPPRAVVYVSCDPATLARDVGRLQGWRVTSVTCFDMFPQTAHVETVCELVPEVA